MNTEYAFKKGEQVLVSLNGIYWFYRTFITEFEGLFYVQNLKDSPLIGYEHIKIPVEELLELTY